MKFLKINKKELRNYVIVLLTGLVLGWIFFHSSDSGVSHDDMHDHQEDETIWTCSMHPQIRQNKPGLCPICNMDLVPVVQDNVQEEGVDPDEIRMSASAMKLADIQTMKVRKDYSNKEIFLLGTVKPDERKLVELTARYAGRIENMYVNFTGQQVRKGEKLVTIYSPELITAQKELLEAMVYKTSNPAFYSAVKNKLKLWDLSDEQILAIETGGEPKQYFDVLSPITGTVTNRHITTGDYVKEGNALFQVVDLRNIWVMFDVYERDLAWLKSGDEVRFTTQSIPGKEYAGKITYIDPFVDPDKRVVRVRVEVPNPERTLKPEMFVNGVVEARISGNEMDLLIPKTSVLWTGKRSVVYVKVPGREKPTFRYRSIITGPEVGDFYVVKEGLSEGEEIAVNGVFKIDAAAQLAGKTSMMNPELHDQAQGTSDHQVHVSNVEHAEFKVSGNCSMCKTRIEKAAMAVPGVNSANWDVDTKMVHLSYNHDKTSLKDIHKAIAAVGHDTEVEQAPDSVYDKLPGCCKYSR